MREISFDEKPSDLPIYTALVHGSTRSGKTRWAATWPRPLILADSIEGGYQTVQSMTSDELFEPDMPPIIWAIESPSDLAQASAKMDPLIASGRIRTIVFDAFSFYVEFYLAHIIKMQGDKADNRAAYGDLGKHLRFVRGLLHLKGINVVWNCLTADPSDDNPKGRPQIPGAQGTAFPAAVSFLLHSRVVQRREAGKIIEETYNLHTRQFGAYMAGHRLGIKADQLPDPFVGDYAQFMTCLGHDPAKIRELLKKNTPIKASIAPPAQVAAVAAQTKLATTTIAAKPPITNISAPNRVGILPSSGGNNKPANIVKAK
jgi:hypothetical protein